MVSNHSASPIAVLRVVFAILLLAAVAEAQWLNHPSPAIPRLPDGKPNLSAPAPTAPDGKPDLSGIWAAECGISGLDACFTQGLFFDLAKDLNAADVQMTPWAQAIQTQREARNHVDDPYGYCLPQERSESPSLVVRSRFSARARSLLSCTKRSAA